MRQTSSLRRAVAIAICSIGAVSLLGGCVAAQKQERPKPPRVMSLEDASVYTVEGRDVYLLGQPSPGALREFAERGGSAVVNLRRDSEMEFLPFYADSVRSMPPLRYTHIPLTSSTYSPDAYERYRAALDSTEGPVLLHCAGGGRARVMQAIHLADVESLTADEAARRVTEEDPPPDWLVAAVYRGMGLEPPNEEG